MEYYQVEKLESEIGLWIPCGRAATTALDVRGLMPGMDYKFRVLAVNEEGESSPLESDDLISAKDPFSESDPPRNLEILDYDQESADLKWNPPRDNGGAEITGYLIEKKDNFGKWVRAHEVPGNQTKCTVPKLSEGKMYEFRVRAINAAGESSPSNEVGPITCKARNLKPKINRKALLEVYCKAGEPFSFDVNVEGEPSPEKKWLSNGKEILLSDRIKVVHSANNTKVYVRSAVREDTGTLTLTAENINGLDTADVRITVIDVPGSPTGPLSVKNITAKDCELEWKPPKDNGGLPVTGYTIERCDETIGGRWTVIGDTDGPETTFKVPGLMENHKYKFRVCAVNKEGKSKPLETFGSYEAKNPFEVPSKPGQPKVINFDVDWTQLEWDKPEFDGGSPITGYVIEKRDNQSQKWEECCKTEGEEPVCRVRQLIEQFVYEWRVKATNQAGESVPSEPSVPHRFESFLF